MKIKFILLILFALFLIDSCKKVTKPEVDNEAPMVTILTLQENDIVFGIVTISVIATDNEAIERVELWIDGNFTGIKDKTEPYSLEWNTQYFVNGMYIVIIKAFDVNGNKSDSKPVKINVLNESEPTASFTISPTSGTINATFTFDATGSSDFEDAVTDLQVRWDWENDGVYDTNYNTTKTATYQYTTPGVYTVKIEVIDTGGLTDTAIKTVSVNNITPAASFTVSPLLGTTLTTFTFDATGSSDFEDAVTDLQVRWDWENDGIYDTNYSTTKTATHQYTTSGIYTVKLEVMDTDGLTDTTIKTIRLDNEIPIASFTINPSSGTTLTTFTFDATGSSDFEDAVTDLQVRWDWENDGIYDTNYSTTKTATHIYNIVGTYTIKLEVKDTEGLTGNTWETVTVNKTEPTASFTVSPTSGTTRTEFIFDASGSSDYEDATSELKFRWDWKNDGNYDTNWMNSMIGYYQYTTAGTYTVKLQVKDSDELTNTTTMTVSVSTDNTITDIDGNRYQTVTIGDQLWLAENLRVTHYRNGDAIPNITDNTQWSNLYTGAYCNLGNDASYVATYGRLYNWFAVNDSRGLAPAGWHVASDEEWKKLEMYLGMSHYDADQEGYRGTDEGRKLKSTSGWNDLGPGIENGNNVSGFSALPGGARNQNGGFYGRGGNALFWTSTTEFNQWGTGSAWYRFVTFNFDGVYRKYFNKHDGYSVRCIKN